MIRALLLLVAALLSAAAPAQAHRLKVFATVAEGEVSGYAFFIGAGRPRAASWSARDGGGAEVAAGKTDAEGRFAFPVPAGFATELRVTVDAHDAHVATATLPAARFGGPAEVPGGEAVSGVGAGATGPRPARGDGETAALVEAAAQRAVAPLLERIEEMDSRLRVVDALSGVFLILGLGGIALWARGRRG